MRFVDRRSLLILGLTFLSGESTSSAIDYVIPAVTKAPGEEGSNWVSDVRIVNRATHAGDWSGNFPDREILFTYYYTEEDNGELVVRSRSREVFDTGPGHLREFNDILGSLWSLSKSSGALVISTRWPISVFSRTYDSATGCAGAIETEGQFVPAFTSADQYPRQMLPSVVVNPRYRTNIGLYNGNAVPVTATVKVYTQRTEDNGNDDEDPVVPEKTFTLPAHGRIQDPVASAGVNGFSGFGEIESSLPLYAYSSIIDNASQDAVFVPGRLQISKEHAINYEQPISFSGGCPCVVPVAACWHGNPPCTKADLAACPPRSDCRSPFSGRVSCNVTMKYAYPTVEVARPAGARGAVYLRNFRYVVNGTEIRLPWERFSGGTMSDLGGAVAPGACGYSMLSQTGTTYCTYNDLCRNDPSSAFYCFSAQPISGDSTGDYLVTAFVGKDDTVAHLFTPDQRQLLLGREYAMNQELLFRVDVLVEGNLSARVGLDFRKTTAIEDITLEMSHGIIEGPTDGWVTMQCPPEEIRGGTYCPAPSQ